MSSQSPTTQNRSKPLPEKKITNPTGSYLYDAVLSPFYDSLTALLWPRWVHPNAITILGAVFCATAIYAFHLAEADDTAKKRACIFWTLYHMCDSMDGKQARRTKQTSRLGGFLDHAVDGIFGVHMGYSAVVQVVLGVPPSSPSFQLGKHCFSLLWLAPHIVHQLDRRKSLVYGTKWLSVDEGFLAVSALLFYHGWINRQPFIPDEGALMLAQATVATIGMGFVAWSSLSSPSPKGRMHNLSWTSAYFLFAAVGFGTQEPTVWWAFWTPFMMLSVIEY